MKDFIIRSELFNRLATVRTLGEAYALMQDMPFIERETGKWERTGRKNVYGGYEVKCSVCGDTLMLSDISREHYCRNCGAKMEVSDED